MIEGWSKQTAPRNVDLWPGEKLSPVTYSYQPDWVIPGRNKEGVPLKKWGTCQFCMMINPKTVDCKFQSALTKNNTELDARENSAIPNRPSWSS